MNQVSTVQKPSYADRVWGCLFGGAIGDAFGYPIEFWSRKQIEKVYGPEGLLEPVPATANDRFLVSDDTQMTMFTVEGLLLTSSAESDKDAPTRTSARRLESIRRAYLDWLLTQQGKPPDRRRFGDERAQNDGEVGALHTKRLVNMPMMWHTRAPGNTCLSALRAGGLGTPESPINHSKGCGGVMRVAPVGLLRDTPPEAAFELGARAAALTHGHPSGYLSAGFLAAVIRHLVDGSSLVGAVENTIPVLEQWRGHEETLAAVRKALAAAQDVTPCSRLRGTLGEGWVGEEALSIALWAALVAPSFVEAVRLAANHDGDSDSTASIAGQLWGAEHGRTGIPEKWAKKLDVAEVLEELAERLGQENATPSAKA